MYEQYSSQEFEEKYTYSGNLGAFWTPEKTAFRLWAPTAGAVSIRLYRSGDPGADDLLAQLRMQPDVCGTWTAERFGNLNGIYYTYLVTVDGQTREVCDPYAKNHRRQRLPGDDSGLGFRQSPAVGHRCRPPRR